MRRRIDPLTVAALAVFVLGAAGIVYALLVAGVTVEDCYTTAGSRWC